MGADAVLAAVLALAGAVGPVGVAWLRARPPSIADDASVLLAEPPPELTAATAAVVGGSSTRVAFMAALLDLASRDEIRFRDEGRIDGRSAVGIEIRGDESSDARVVLNRRRPIGEPEAFVLEQLREVPLLANVGADPVAPLAQAMSGLMQYAAFASDPNTLDDTPSERARRSRGLFVDQASDPAALIAAVEAHRGRPLTQAEHDRFLQFGTLAAALSAMGAPPAPVPAAGPGEAEARRPEPEARLDELTLPGPRDALKPERSLAPGGAQAIDAAPGHAYITAAQALHLSAPLLFRTVAETYARRHGWITGFSIVNRLRWQGVAILELGLAVVALAVGGGTLASVPGGLALGLATGGVITLLLAPQMRGSTAAGALLEAQLAAYRRTLRLSLAEAPLAQGTSQPGGVGWLTTPDQVLVWATALGLGPELERYVVRVAAGASDQRPLVLLGGSEGGAASAVSDTRAVWAGIEAIGSEPRSLSATAPQPAAADREGR